MNQDDDQRQHQADFRRDQRRRSAGKWSTYFRMATAAESESGGDVGSAVCAWTGATGQSAGIATTPNAALPRTLSGDRQGFVCMETLQTEIPTPVRLPAEH